MTTIVVKDELAKVMAGLKSLKNADVLIGIPSEAAGRKEAGITNAEIGFINEFGSPMKHIPPRPHLIPGVKNSRPESIPIMKKGILQALKGNDAAAIVSLKRAGFCAVKFVQAKITEGPFAPLAPYTIQRRAERGRAHAKVALAMMAKGETPPADMVKPLIDTGEYRRAITFVVVDRKSRKTIG